MNRLPEQFPAHRRLLLAAYVAVCTLAWLPSTAWSQDRFPSRPIEIVVPWVRAAVPTSWHGGSPS